MIETVQLRRMAMLVGLCLALAGCLLTPGHFTSSLDIRRDGAFTYRYAGEIRVLGLLELARLRDQENTANNKFDPHCWFPLPAWHPPAAAAPGASPPRSNAMPVIVPPRASSSGLPTIMTVPPPPGLTPRSERVCTDAEVTQQRQQWESAKQTRAANTKRDLDRFSTLVGGIDLNSPTAAEEIAVRLRRQAGWRRVDYKGTGLYDVDFAVSGRLTHDFAFPTIEKMPAAAPFIAIYRHADGTVRIDAPAFNGAGNSQALTMMMAMANVSKMGAPTTPNGLSEVNGNFTLTTDAAILANNTDEGPSADPVGQRLTWTITPRTNAAPSALLRLISASK